MDAEAEYLDCLGDLATSAAVEARRQADLAVERQQVLAEADSRIQAKLAELQSVSDQLASAEKLVAAFCVSAGVPQRPSVVSGDLDLREIRRVIREVDLWVQEATPMRESLLRSQARLANRPKPKPPEPPAPLPVPARRHTAVLVIGVLVTLAVILFIVWLKTKT